MSVESSWRHQIIISFLIAEYKPPTLLLCKCTPVQLSTPYHIHSTTFCQTQEVYLMASRNKANSFDIKSPEAMQSIILFTKLLYF